MPTKRLPVSANIDHLKHQAKNLLAAIRAHELSAFQRAREFHPRCAQMSDEALGARTFTLSDAQLAIAREYGYASWPRLKVVVAERGGVDPSVIHNDRIDDPVFAQALDFLDEGDVAGLRAHLAAHPELAHRKVVFEGDNYFNDPTLLEFVAENPIRQNHLPANIVDVARVILEARGEADPSRVTATLELVCSGQVARECKVQVPLITLLCDHGADPVGAMTSALVHGEFAAVEALLARGAPLDIAAAAATGRGDVVQQLLADADQGARDLSLSYAALHGHADIVALLLRGGVDPNRYNPPGGHSHCTALHSAAFAGHVEAVRALLDGGARGDIGDIHRNMTALQWAEYAGHAPIVVMLTAHASGLGTGSEAGSD